MRHNLDVIAIEFAVRKYGTRSLYSFTFNMTCITITVRSDYDNHLIAEIWHDTKEIKLKEF